MAATGVYVFPRLLMEKVKTIHNNTVPEPEGWLIIAFSMLAVSCLTFIPCYYTTFIDRTINMEFSTLLSGFLLVNLFSLFLAALAIVGKFIFRSKERVKITKLSARYFLSMILIVVSCFFFARQPMIKLANTLAVINSEISPQISASVLASTVDKIDDRFTRGSYKRDLAKLYLVMNEPEKAKRVLNDKENRKTFGFFTNLKPGDLDKIIKLKQKTNSPDTRYKALLDLAESYFVIDFKDTSLALLSEAIKLEPQNPDGYIRRAYVNSSYYTSFLSSKSEKKKEEAIKDADKALSLAEKNRADYLILRAQFDQEHGMSLNEPDNKYLLEALKLVEEKPEGLKELYKSKIYNIMGDGNKSERYLLEAEKMGFASQDLDRSIMKNTGINYHFSKYLFHQVPPRLNYKT